MRFVIDALVLGTENHLLVDEESIIDWTEDIPSDTYHYSGCFKDNNCLDTLLELNHIGLKPQDIILQKYQTLLDTLNVNIRKVQYSCLLTKSQRMENIKHVVLALQSAVVGVDTKYYESTFVPTTKIFSRLQPTLINENIFKTLYQVESNNKSVLKSFKTKDDYTKQIKYDRFKTRTGRLTVESGPNILLLPKVQRKLLKSRWETGHICQYDFKALEIRIALYECGKRCDDPDVYSFLKREVFLDEVDRGHVKAAIISLLYGQNKYALAKDLELSVSRVEEIQTSLLKYFQFYDTFKRIKADFVKYGYVKNRYGRKILIDDPLDNIIFNSYIQSTGVDVTLFGFEELCKTQFDDSKLNEIKPIFLLHDALFFDVKYMNLLQKVVWVKVPGYMQRFPLQLEQVT